MAPRIDESDTMLPTFQRFQEMDAKGESEARKKLVRELEGRVKSDEVAVSGNQVRQYLASDFELARILVHLSVENGKVSEDAEAWMANILSEWELLRRRELRHDASRMSLYYAVRACLRRLKAAPDMAVAANDRFLMREIESICPSP